MEAVGGLGEDHAPGAVEDVAGHFLAAVGGEAVEEDGLAGQACQKRGIDLEWSEDGPALVGLVFLPHARPDVGVDHLRPLDGLVRVVLDDQGVTGKRFLESGAKIGRELVARGRGQDELEPEQGRGLGQRTRHVVAVADEHELDAFETTEGLVDRQHVGHRLAWVGQVGQGVDDRHGGVTREFLDGRVRVGPDRQGVDVLADHAREVGEAFAAAHADVLVAEEDRAAAELGDRRLEADPGPERRLLEDQAQRAARKVKRP